MTNGPGKSDRPTVPEKSPNNAGQPAAEGMEGRGLAKGNLPQQNASRTPSREDALPWCELCSGSASGALGISACFALSLSCVSAVSRVSVVCFSTCWCAEAQKLVCATIRMTAVHGHATTAALLPMEFHAQYLLILLIIP